jgi:hypothetical protein
MVIDVQKEHCFDFCEHDLIDLISSGKPHLNLPTYAVEHTEPAVKPTSSAIVRDQPTSLLLL